MAGRGSSNEQARSRRGQVARADGRAPASRASIIWRSLRSEAPMAPTTPQFTPESPSSEVDVPAGRNSRPHPYEDTREATARQWLDSSDRPPAGSTEGQPYRETIAGEASSGDPVDLRPLQAAHGDIVLADTPFREEYTQVLAKSTTTFGFGTRSLGTVGLVILMDSPEPDAG